MKRSFFLFLISLFFVLSPDVSAQSPGKILSLANRALGGEKILKSARSRAAKGRITRLSDGASGNYLAQTEAPNFYAESFDLNGFEIAGGYNGKSGWTRNSKDGLRTLTGEASRDFQAEAAFRSSRWLNYKQDKAKLAFLNQANAGGKTANVLLLTTAKGVQIKLFFDAASNLLLREEFSGGATRKIFDYGDYRKVGNIFEPFSIKMTAADGETYEIRLDEITHNRAIAGSVFDFPQISAEPLPDIKTLLAEIRANTDKIDSILENYSYTATRVEREIDKAGNLIEKGTETVSFSFYKSYRVTRLLAKNGKPLSPGERADEDKKVEKQIREIEERIAEKEKKQQQQQQQRDVAANKAGTPSNEGGEGQRITLSDALRGSLLVNPRRERLRGRDVIVFDYEPNPDYKPQTRFEKVFALCSGAVWVDAADKQIVRLEASLTQSSGNFLAKLKRGASFTLENERVNDEIWLPSLADINLSVRILFAGININNLIRYGDYKRFDTQVKDGKVDEIKP
ncbi:MAG: hypothetical protein M3384_14410 [Acidobacteriota bacterium]|nr:hypothetical protein [Acidobacteriota bacterium]